MKNSCERGDTKGHRRATVREMNLPLPTCGLIITSPAGWLLAHVTGKAHWDLPKGKSHAGEDFLSAALRECHEETGLDLAPHRHLCIPLGLAPYNRGKGKMLALFALALSEALDLNDCQCHTFVTTRGPEPVLEMDGFAWVPADEVGAWVNRRMARHLRARALI
jgi:8-oxo-dGTP pyrophosphatase MutT (NUDIX family)